MRHLSQCIQQNPNNFDKTTKWTSKKPIYTVLSIISVPAVGKGIYTVPPMPTRWAKSPK